ncbi:MAG: Ig-like domain-containing protein, partial [Anaerolineae bacterium]|nr:Ig-like domain-containing protein [Anaerolineae bacterium]
FTTVPYPRVVSTSPFNGETVSPYQSVWVEYNAPMDTQSFIGKVHVDPQPEDLSINPYDDYLGINFAMQPDTTYTITVDAGVTDVYGNPVKEATVFSFTTESYRPALNIATRGDVVFTSAYRPDTRLLAVSTNITTLNGRLGPLETRELIGAMTEWGYLDLSQFKPPRISREWSQAIDEPRNKVATYPVYLAGESGGQLAPGLYYVEVDSPEFWRLFQEPLQQPIRTILVVGTANLTMKRTSTGELLVWATDLQSGQPVVDVTIRVFDNAKQQVAEGRTNEGGLVRFSDLASPDQDYYGYWVEAQGDGVFSLGNTQWNDNFQAWEFDAYEDFQPRQIVSYMYTDQPIYRPGRPVYYRGVVRDRDDVTYTAPTGEPVEIVVYDTAGQELLRETRQLNNFGAFSGKFDLAQDAVPGQGYIQATVRGYTFNVTYSVAEFRPPEFLVSASADAPAVAAGDTIRVTFDGKFLFGGPVSDGLVNWTATANMGFFPYTGEGNYDFGADTEWVYQRPVASGSGRLDAQGQLVVDVPADLGGIQRTQTFTIEASVTDISNQTVSGRTSVTVHPASLYVGLSPARYVGVAGQPMDINLIAVDWASQPIAGKTIGVKVFSLDWKQDPTTLDWERVREQVAEGSVTTGEDGKAVYTFTPASAGVYEIEASARDERERIALSSTRVWVQGPQRIIWDRDQEHLTLVADKKGEYQPGETARILIASPFAEPVKALVTVERAGILSTALIDVEGSATYELPIVDAYAPNVFISVSLFRGSGEGTADESITPELRYGLLEIRVAVQKRLNVEVTPSTTRAKPGDEVTFDVRVTDLTGEPVSAEVGLSMSDLATLSVGAPSTGPIFDFFWSPRGLGVQTSATIVRLIDTLKEVDVQDMARRELASAPMMADGLAAGAAMPTMTAAQSAVPRESEERDLAQAGADVAVRTDFVDTPLWVANLATDATGRGQVSVTLPDNLTTWRLDARAVTLDTAVGDATLDILSTLPLLVRPATPRFFVVGDEAELAVVVNNNTDRDLSVDVSLDAAGVMLRAGASQTVDIPKDGRVRITWLATVQDVEAVDLTFTATSGEYADASKPAVGIGPDRLLPVYRYLAPDTVATAGALRNPGERTEGILLPSQALAPEGQLTVRLNTSLAAATLDGLTYLRNFPYQCIEQTVSRFLPNVITYRAFQQFGLDDDEMRAKLNDAVQYALARLAREQKPDGGWGWYPKDESNLLTTSYALWGLIEARDADFQVDQTMIDRAIGFIFTHMSNAGQQTPDWELNRGAFVAYVVARAGSPNVTVMESLFAVRERMQLYARALLAQAYDMARNNANTAQDRINTLISDLQSAAILSGTGAHWEEAERDWWNWNSNTRTTAIVLDTLVRLTPDSELLPNVVRWLMTGRKGDVWETTQETAWAVMALTRWMAASGELEAAYDYSVALNGTELGSGRADESTLRDTIALKADVTTMLREQVNRLTFTHGEGDGALYYTATLDVKQPVEAIEPTDRGIRLERTYFIDEKPVTGAKVGDVITIVLDITTTRDLYYVVIDDPLPAGAEAIDRSLQTTAQVGQRPELSNVDWRWYGWGWWWFSETAIQTEKVTLTAQYLPRGAYRYVYQVQATSPGVYRVIPPNGHEFYFPEVFGRGAGSLFTITQ